MIAQIAAAATFLASFLRNQESAGVEVAQHFEAALKQVMTTKFREVTWDPSVPSRGSAYRCLLSTSCVIDPVIESAARMANVPLSVVMQLMPNEISLWVDPDDVAYRIGGHGRIYSLNHVHQKISPMPSPPRGSAAPTFAGQARFGGGYRPVSVHS